jgi:calpain, invertebrate
LDQGYLGNCWFIAAAALVTQRQEIFSFVIPQDQSFDSDSYCGMFHFRFWQFGRWYDVVVDDLLPVMPDNHLVFCSNKTEPNEFWSCLLEKAYAKLSWSYEGLDAGQTADGLIDMTGGIEETFDLKNMKQDLNSFFGFLNNSFAHDSMMGSSINASSNEMEARLSNGLVKGHAYSITAFVTLNLYGRPVRLLRLRYAFYCLSLVLIIIKRGIH